jgi:hypothetical protein
MFTSFIAIFLALNAETPGQRPEFQQAKVEARAVSGLDRDVAAVVASAGPDDIVWVGWRVASVARTDWACVQHAEPVTEPRTATPGELIVMARIAGRRVERIRTYSPGCPIDTSGRPVVWLDGVTGAASVAWLGAQATAPDTPGVTPDERKRLRTGAMDALSLHRDPAALAFLTQVLK